MEMKVNKVQIEHARQFLLAELFRENAGDRLPKKAAVKQLLGAVMAARELGMSFEVIAKNFEKSGLVLTPATLRNYYFELKTETETRQAAERHARNIARTKKIIDLKFLEKHAEHAEQATLAHLHNQKQEPSLDGSCGTPGRIIEANSPSPPISLEQPKPTMVEPAAGEKALHINQIERQSLQTLERTPLQENLVLKNDYTVIYESGQLFFGYLSKKQIYLLRTVGKLIKVSDSLTS